MSEHEHTPHCAGRSRYSLTRVSVFTNDQGRADVRVAFKPSAACWDDLETTIVVRDRVVSGLPRSEDEAIEQALDLLTSLMLDRRGRARP